LTMPSADDFEQLRKQIMKAEKKIPILEEDLKHAELEYKAFKSVGAATFASNMMQSGRIYRGPLRKRFGRNSEGKEVWTAEVLGDDVDLFTDADSDEEWQPDPEAWGLPRDVSKQVLWETYYKGEIPQLKQKAAEIRAQLDEVRSFFTNSHDNVALIMKSLEDATRVHLISTPYKGPGAEKALKVHSKLHNPPEDFCFNPNTDLGLFATGKRMTPEEQEKKWLEIWTEIALVAKDKPGSTIHVMSLNQPPDGKWKKADLQGNAQRGELNIAVMGGFKDEASGLIFVPYHL